MRLASIHVRAAPGLAGPVSLEALSPGLVVLVGPNASGKSTVCRAVREALWPTGEARLDVVTEWVGPGPALRATLVHGRVSWSSPPARLPDASAASAYLLTMSDLLRSDGVTDQQIARRLQVELAGGFDLQAAKRGFGERTRPVGAAALKRARGLLREAEAAADELSRREGPLQRLRAQVAEAALARDALVDVGRAEERNAALWEAATLRGERDALPDGAGRLSSADVGRYDAAVDRRERASRRVTVAEAALADLAARRAPLAFPSSPPERVELEAWRSRLGGARVVAGRLEIAELEVAERWAAVRAAGAAVSGDAAARELGADALVALEELAERRRAAHGVVAGAESAVDALPEVGPAGDAGALRRELELLRSWAAAPESPPKDSTAWLWIAAAAVAALGLAALIVGGAAGGWAGVAPGAALLGIATGLGVAALVAALRPRPRSRRALIEADPLAAGASPGGWRAEEVTQRLAELEGRLADLAVAERLAPLRSVALRRLGKAQEALVHEALALLAEARRLGLDEELVGLSVPAQARRLTELAAARTAHAEVVAAADQLAVALGATLDGFVAWAASCGVEAAEPDVAWALAAVEALAERLGGLEALDVEGRRLERERGVAAAEAKDAEEARLASLVAAGLPDRDALVAAAQAAPRHAALTARLEALEATALRLERGLEPGLAALDADPLAARRADLEALADRYEELVGHVTRAEAELDAAAKGRALEDARAAVAEAEASLVAERDAAWTDQVGRLLADAIEGQRAVEHAPPALRRARTWFARFTRDAFGLELEPDGFRARDQALGELRGLAELSDATRIQLLLAARIAHIEAIEDGGPALPWILDEVLSTTDAGRFDAIAEALLELVAGGRQLVYVTADHAEVEAWRRVCARLGRLAPDVRDLGSSSAMWAVPGLPVAPTVSSPEGLDAEAYARALRVPRPAGFQPVGSWHLFFVLRDDLPALRRCLVAGVTTLGQWSALRRRGAALLDEATSARVDRRVALLEAIVDRWRLGRAPPLTWADVEATGAVTPTFEPELRRLLAEDPDPAAFLAATQALPRFRGRSPLADALRDRGLLPDEAPLTGEALAEAAARDALEVGEQGAWPRWVAAVLAGG